MSKRIVGILFDKLEQKLIMNKLYVLFFLLAFQSSFGQYIYDPNGNLLCSKSGDYFYNSSNVLLGRVNSNYVYNGSGALIGAIDTSCNHQVCFEKPLSFPYAYRQSNYVYLNSGYPFMYTNGGFFYSGTGNYLGYYTSIDTLSLMIYSVYFNSGYVLGITTDEEMAMHIIQTNGTLRLCVNKVPQDIENIVLHDIVGREENRWNKNEMREESIDLSSYIGKGLYMVTLLDKNNTIIHRKKIFL